MYLDIDVKPTKHALYLQGVFVFLVLVLLALAKVAWWQYAVVVVLFAVCFYVQHVRHVPLWALSADDVKEIWYLGMYDDDEREIWQGYLHHAEWVGGAVRLTFYVVVPFEMTHSVVIGKRSVDRQAFAKLGALARFYQA